MTDDRFEQFWAAYPHKVGKKVAEKKYWIVRRDVSHERIMEGLALYKETKPDWKAWCNPATWLNQGRWDDEPADTKAAQPADGSPVRPCPSYLRRDYHDKPKETPEQKARKQLKLDVHDIMRKRGMEPLVMAVENEAEYKRQFEDIAASLSPSTRQQAWNHKLAQKRGAA